MIYVALRMTFIFTFETMRTPPYSLSGWFLFHSSSAIMQYGEQPCYMHAGKCTA
jgi:hypothetical protein